MNELNETQAGAHTPGPWSRAGMTIYALMHHGWHRGKEQFKNRITIQVSCDRECHHDEAESVARLVQSAPVLLEALQRLIDGEPTEDDRGFARAAISWATNGTK